VRCIHLKKNTRRTQDVLAQHIITPSSTEDDADPHYPPLRAHHTEVCGVNMKFEHCAYFPVYINSLKTCLPSLFTATLRSIAPLKVPCEILMFGASLGSEKSVQVEFMLLSADRRRKNQRCAT
jgi:hypothetical protein